MRRFSLVSTLIVFCLFASASWAGDAQGVVKNAVMQVQKVLDGSASLKEKRRRISRLYEENFDLDRMASNTLKSDFRRLTPEQKQEFTQKFGQFVLEFYLDKIDKYERNKVEYAGQIVKGSRATVETLFAYKGKMAKANYFLTLKDGRWFIYDFEVEGIRLSSTYRSQFSQVLKERQFKGLMTELNKLIARYKK